MLTDQHLKMLIRGVVEDVRSEKDEALVTQMDERFAALTSTFLSAFPNNDPGDHRRAHERDIEVTKGWARVRAELLIKVITTGVWASAAWLLYAAWEHFLSKVKS